MQLCDGEAEGLVFAGEDPQPTLLQPPGAAEHPRHTEILIHESLRMIRRVTIDEHQAQMRLPIVERRTRELAVDTP